MSCLGDKTEHDTKFNALVHNVTEGLPPKQVTTVRSTEITEDLYTLENTCDIDMLSQHYDIAVTDSLVTGGMLVQTNTTHGDVILYSQPVENIGDDSEPMDGIVHEGTEECNTQMEDTDDEPYSVEIDMGGSDIPPSVYPVLPTAELTLDHTPGIQISLPNTETVAQESTQITAWATEIPIINSIPEAMGGVESLTESGEPNPQPAQGGLSTDTVMVDSAFLPTPDGSNIRRSRGNGQERKLITKPVPGPNQRVIFRMEREKVNGYELMQRPAPTIDVVDQELQRKRKWDGPQNCNYRGFYTASNLEGAFRRLVMEGFGSLQGIRSLIDHNEVELYRPAFMFDLPVKDLRNSEDAVIRTFDGHSWKKSKITTFSSFLTGRIARVSSREPWSRQDGVRIIMEYLIRRLPFLKSTHAVLVFLEQRVTAILEHQTHLQSSETPTRQRMLPKSTQQPISRLVSRAYAANLYNHVQSQLFMWAARFTSARTGEVELWVLYSWANEVAKRCKVMRYGQTLNLWRIVDVNGQLVINWGKASPPKSPQDLKRWFTAWLDHLVAPTLAMITLDEESQRQYLEGLRQQLDDEIDNWLSDFPQDEPQQTTAQAQDDATQRIIAECSRIRVTRHSLGRPQLGTKRLFFVDHYGPHCSREQETDGGTLGNRAKRGKMNSTPVVSQHEILTTYRFVTTEKLVEIMDKFTTYLLLPFMKKQGQGQGAQAEDFGAYCERYASSRPSGQRQPPYCGLEAQDLLMDYVSLRLRTIGWLGDFKSSADRFFTDQIAAEGNRMGREQPHAFPENYQPRARAPHADRPGEQRYSRSYAGALLEYILHPDHLLPYALRHAGMCDGTIADGWARYLGEQRSTFHRVPAREAWVLTHHQTHVALQHGRWEPEEVRDAEGLRQFLYLWFREYAVVALQQSGQLPRDNEEQCHKMIDAVKRRCSWDIDTWLLHFPGDAQH